MKLHFVHFLSYIHFNSVDVHILNNVSSGEVSACTVEVILKVRLQTARNSV